jgi:hypothetical protein
MEEKVTIIQIETKQTKAGAPMWTATTSAGKMSCFEKGLADQLFNLINKEVIVEVEMQGVYKNLKSIVTNPTPAQTSMPITQVVEKPKYEMLISYMHDQVVAQINKENPVNLDIDKAWEQAYKNVMNHYKKIKTEA